MSTTAAAGLDHATLLEQFRGDGFAVARGVLDRDRLARLRALGDGLFEDAAAREAGRHGFPFVLARLYQLHPEFAAFAADEPLYSLMTAALGAGFQACGMNLLRNPSGQAIDRFHVDDVVEFPLPPGVSRHAAPPPAWWLTVQIPLSDIDAPEHGPTEFVPGSHASGRAPDDIHAPRFEGRGPVAILCRPGDLYLQNNQCWHRGAPNTGGRTRYLLQIQYAARWAAARFHPPLPAMARADVLAGADERLRQVLGAADVYALPQAYGR